MRLLARFLKAWLLLCFLLAFFVIPFYLIAIYPDAPPAMPTFMRNKFPYGVIHAPPSLESFLYRLICCGATIGVGSLIAYNWLGSRRTDDKKNHLWNDLFVLQPDRSDSLHCTAGNAGATPRLRSPA